MNNEVTPNFWEGTHPLSEAYSQLNDTLVPGDGPCETLQGELIRAASRIGYDWYNNGWGCNNWSGAVRFIQLKIGTLPNQLSLDTLAKLTRSLGWVYEFSHGEPAPRNEKFADEHVTTITEIVVQALIDNPTLIPNTGDMFNLQEDDYEWPPEEDDSWGWERDDEEE